MESHQWNHVDARETTLKIAEHPMEEEIGQKIALRQGVKRIENLILAFHHPLKTIKVVPLERVEPRTTESHGARRAVADIPLPITTDVNLHSAHPWSAMFIWNSLLQKKRCLMVKRIKVIWKANPEFQFVQRITERVAGQITDLPVPYVTQETLEVIKVSFSWTMLR